MRATGVQHGQADEEIWYAANATPVTKFTADVSVSASLAMTVVDIAGASATNPLDRTMFNTGTSTAASTGSTSATSQPNEIVIADIGWNSTVTLSGATAGYADAIRQQSTVSGNQTGEQAAWLIVSATGPQSFAATLSSSVAWLGAVATFK